MIAVAGVLWLKIERIYGREGDSLEIAMIKFGWVLDVAISLLLSTFCAEAILYVTLYAIGVEDSSTTLSIVV